MATQSKVNQDGGASGEAWRVWKGKQVHRGDQGSKQGPMREGVGGLWVGLEGLGQLAVSAEGGWGGSGRVTKSTGCCWGSGGFGKIRGISGVHGQVWVVGGGGFGRLERLSVPANLCWTPPPSPAPSHKTVPSPTNWSWDHFYSYSPASGS